MKRGIVLLAVIAIVAIGAGIAWAVYGDNLRTALAVRKCNAAWSKLRDYRSDFTVDVELGPLSATFGGAVTFMKPDSYRLDLGGGATPNCRVVSTKQATWVYFPDLKTAVQVEVERGDVSSAVGNQSPRPWVAQASEDTEIKWIGPDEVNGRPCSVLELAPSQEAREDGVRVATPALGKQFDSVLFLESWKRTRVYLDKQTGLPIRGDALKDNGAILFTWSTRNLQINRKLSAADFEFEPPQGVWVVKRKFDPDRPESLLLPPAKGRSLLKQLGDALEEGAKQYLHEQVGGADDGDKSLGEHVLDELTR